MKYDIAFIRSQFPAFSDPDLKGWAFFENAGSSYICQAVIDQTVDYYSKMKVQPYYDYPTSKNAGKRMDESYKRMADFLGVKESEVHYGPSTTQNNYVLARALRPLWREGDEIIVSCQDHEANAGFWRQLERTGIVVKEWHVDSESGLLNPEDLHEMINFRTRFLAYPHCSNIIGHINPVKEINEIAHEHDIITLVDGVAMAPHGFPDISELDADIYLFSLYKTWGPHAGLMTVKEDLLKRLENQSHYFKSDSLRSKLLPAGPDHTHVVAAAGILDYFDVVYDYHFSDVVEPIVKNHFLRKLFEDYEKSLLTKLLTFLKSRDDLRIIGPDDPEIRASTVSILPLNRSASELVPKLAKHKCMLASGHFYSMRPLEEMHIKTDPGVLRMSFLHYTTMEEIDQLIAALEAEL